MTDGRETSCPQSHAEELIFSVWPGTVHACDCLDDEREKSVTLNTICPITGHNREKNNPPEPTWIDGGCYHSPALPPVVQHTINGMKVCAIRSSDLSFANTKRPIQS